MALHGKVLNFDRGPVGSRLILAATWGRDCAGSVPKKRTLGRASFKIKNTKKITRYYSNHTFSKIIKKTVHFFSQLAVPVSSLILSTIR